jgi:hypothetical protein
MANMLIIDDQAWVMDLCRKGLAGEAHQILATYDIEAVSKNIFLFKPSIVFLNQYLKHGFLVWDVLRDITAADELRQKVSSLLGRGPAVQKTKEIKKYTITKLVIKNEQH